MLGHKETENRGRTCLAAFTLEPVQSWVKSHKICELNTSSQSASRPSDDAVRESIRTERFSAPIIYSAHVNNPIWNWISILESELELDQSLNKYWAVENSNSWIILLECFQCDRSTMRLTARWSASINYGRQAWTFLRNVHARQVGRLTNGCGLVRLKWRIVWPFFERFFLQFLLFSIFNSSIGLIRQKSSSQCEVHIETHLDFCPNFLNFTLVGRIVIGIIEIVVLQ